MAMQFPKKFLWGASTSAHQVEGNNHNQWTVWELENARAKAAQAKVQYDDLDVWQHIKEQASSPENYISGHAADHYIRYEEDFDLLKKLNLNAFRFSVEWSRIEPKEGSWNAEAIEHYKRYIAGLKKRNIEPMMTLMHFTLPVWFAEKGGFEKRSNVKYFVRFAEKIVEELGKDIRYIITINEPEVYASESYSLGRWPPAKQSKWLAFKVISNQIYAHNKVAKKIHAMNRRYKVSIAKNSQYFFPGDDAIVTRLSARIYQYIQDDYVLKRVKRTSDFLAINYYFTNRMHGYRIHNEDQKLNDLGWDMHPENLQYVLERLSDKYKMPLIISENGVVDRDDVYRKWWLGKTMIAIHEALKNGADVKGYFHWSLINNFEWAHGSWPDFGLVKVDQKTLERKPEKSAIWWASVLGKIQKETKK